MKLTENEFRDWLRRTYGVQDYEAYRATQTEEIAIQFARSIAAQAWEEGVRSATEAFGSDCIKCNPYKL